MNPCRDSAGNLIQTGSIIDHAGITIDSLFNQLPNLRRIVACVNACYGIPTGELLRRAEEIANANPEAL